jgi:hypothetical protein
MGRKKNSVDRYELRENALRPSLAPDYARDSLGMHLSIRMNRMALNEESVNE